MRDKEHLSVPLMFYQQLKEWNLTQPHWHPMPPPREGNYLVRVEIEDAARGVVMRSVRLDWFDGTRWPRRGGYVAYTGWREVPGV